MPTSCRALARSLLLLLPILLMTEGLAADETTTSKVIVTSVVEHDVHGRLNGKVSRRLIEERLTPPGPTDYSTIAQWNGNGQTLVDIQRVNKPPPRLVEKLDDGPSDKATPKKTRTASSITETSCCGSKLSGANGFLEEKDKSREKEASEDLERGTAAGPAPRFHGNNPTDDRYGQGWRSFNYLGYNKDRGYQDQRNYHLYDRYNGAAQRPITGYAQDGDRYGMAQRPGQNYGADGDRYSASSSNRPGSFQSINYAFGHGSGGNYDRPRPGSISNFGTGSTLGNEGENDYLYSEGGSSSGMNNLQTQKAVALKALAGVALIGAAAALATNPVFLPIGALSGRKKRSAGVKLLNLDNYTLGALLQAYGLPNKMVQGDQSERNARNIDGSVLARQELVISPQCVARLACHVHRDYLEELEKTKVELSKLTSQGNKTETGSSEETLHGLEHWFNSLVHNNILLSDYLSEELKSVIRSAVAVGSNRTESCNKFSCLNVRDPLNKRTT